MHETGQRLLIENPPSNAGNREAAFLHAITTAGIVHTLTKNCTLGNIKDCQCRKMRAQNPHREDWTWSGCSENIKFGESISRKFVDDLEKGKGARTAMNLQNNEVGRRVSFSLAMGTDTLTERRQTLSRTQTRTQTHTQKQTHTKRRIQMQT